MKKTLEDELMSLAHRILKLSGKEDLEQMKILTGELYEKLCVLSFAEKHFDELKPSFNFADVEELLDQKEEKEPVADAETEPTKKKYAPEMKSYPPIKPEISGTGDGENFKNSLIYEDEEVKEEPAQPEEIQPAEEDSSEIDLREISVHYDDLPQFEPVTSEEIPSVKEVPVEKTPAEETPEEKMEEKKEDVQAEEKAEAPATSNPLEDLFSTFNKPSRRNDTLTHKRSLNQSLKLGLSFGLNDRIAFIKNLFENSEEDYNRVISQLNSFDKFSEARDFIEQQVKPDYNWEDKEVYEERFFHVLEQRMEE